MLKWNFEGMCMNFINTIDDLFSMLDRYTEGVDWNTFYIKRDKPAPFLKFCNSEEAESDTIKVNFDEICHHFH